MQGAVLYGPRDVRVEERPTPAIVEPTDAIVRLPVTCICGSDLWPYRGLNPMNAPTPMGHEYCGIVEEIGRGVTAIKKGQFVIGSFFASDNTCPHCRFGYQTSCQHRALVGGAQAPLLRVPLADGTLVATRDVPAPDLFPSLLALSDVMGTGWFAADAANVRPGATVAVVGDGAVGLLGVLSAKQMGAERIIAMSRHESRQALAASSGQPTSSPSVEKKASPASRTSRRVSARIRSSNASAPSSRWRRRSASHVRGGRSGTSACRTASNSTARISSTGTCACLAAPRPYAATCQT
jgi:threonine dehydrogenase-like Zn-dependent dehydrogenase